MSTDPHAEELFVLMKLKSLAPANVDEHTKLVIGGVLFNELVTKHSPQTRQYLEQFETEVQVALSALRETREDCELVSILIDQLAGKSGTDPLVASRAARTHRVYVPVSERRLKNWEDAEHAAVKAHLPNI